MKDDTISRQALCRYAINQKDKSVTPNDIMRFPSAQPEQDREFIKLAVRNSNGRPYYSIIYLEFDGNGVGHDFEGYSSYSLDVISDYLKKYFMPSAQSEVIHCKDCEWWTKQDKSLQGRCELMQMYPTGEWYCGNAQKKVKDEKRAAKR